MNLSYSSTDSNTLTFSSNHSEPWGHVGLFIVGAYAGNFYERTERELVEDLNQIRADRNMPPLVGSGAWFPKPFTPKYE